MKKIIFPVQIKIKLNKISSHLKARRHEQGRHEVFIVYPKGHWFKLWRMWTRAVGYQEGGRFKGAGGGGGQNDSQGGGALLL